MHRTFGKYFPENQRQNQHDWVRNPFITSAGCQLSLDQQGILLDLSSDRSLKAVFDSVLSSKWTHGRGRMPKKVDYSWTNAQRKCVLGSESTFQIAYGNKGFCDIWNLRLASTKFKCQAISVYGVY